MRVLPHVLAYRPSAGTTSGRRLNTDKENAHNRAPVYFSTKPAQGPGSPGPVQTEQPGRPLQGSKFRGKRTLVTLDAPGTVLMSTGHAVVEPLTPRKVGYFCPETLLFIDKSQQVPDSYMSSSGLCEELKELSAILEGDAPAARCRSAGGFSRTTSSEAETPGSNGMQLREADLAFQERIGETGGQGGEVYAALYRDPETNSEHHVAVKRFPAAATSEQLQSLQREVCACASYIFSVEIPNTTSLLPHASFALSHVPS